MHGILWYNNGSGSSAQIIRRKFDILFGCQRICEHKISVINFKGLSVVSGLFGLFIAANYALTSIILVELITLDRFTNAYGLLLLVQGIANLVGPPLAGMMIGIVEGVSEVLHVKNQFFFHFRLDNRSDWKLRFSLLFVRILYFHLRCINVYPACTWKVQKVSRITTTEFTVRRGSNGKNFIFFS